MLRGRLQPDPEPTLNKTRAVLLNAGTSAGTMTNGMSVWIDSRSSISGNRDSQFTGTPAPMRTAHMTRDISTGVTGKPPTRSYCVARRSDSRDGFAMHWPAIAVAISFAHCMKKAEELSGNTSSRRSDISGQPHHL